MDPVTILGKEVGHTKCNGDMAIMPTGMHDALSLGGVTSAFHPFHYGEGIDVSPQSDGSAAGIPNKDGCEASLSDPLNLQTDPLKMLADDPDGAEFFEAELGVRVQIPPNCDQLRRSSLARAPKSDGAGEPSRCEVAKVIRLPKEFPIPSSKSKSNDFYRCLTLPEYLSNRALLTSSPPGMLALLHTGGVTPN